jgi:shikimate dehydrogenase
VSGRELPGRLVLLGHPVAHSVSPLFQNAALRAAGIPLTYEALDTPPAELDESIDALIASRGAGNATIPHKERVAARCARLTAIAARVGAVNTFRVDADGSLTGHNTDVAGFDHLVRTALDGAEPPRHVALLGAGGAAAAVLAAIESWPRCEVTLYNRSAERRERIAGRFAVVKHTSGDAVEAVQGCSLVVNSTPLGLGESDALPVPIDSLERGAVVVDLVYSRAGTPWVRAARAAGHRAVDGLGMLLEQGALAFEWWFGMPAPREIMREVLRDPATAHDDHHPRESREPSGSHPREGEDPFGRHPLGSHPRESGDPFGSHPRESGDPC